MTNRKIRNLVRDSEKTSKSVFLVFVKRDGKLQLDNINIIKDM